MNEEQKNTVRELLVMVKDAQDRIHKLCFDTNGALELLEVVATMHDTVEAMEDALK